jgi:hypothetical protein
MPEFIADAEVIAQAAMQLVSPLLVDKYAVLIRFLVSNPDAASKMKGKRAPAIGSETYIRDQAAIFASSRHPKAPAPPATVPDELVSFILHEYFGIPVKNLARASREHLLSMAAENLVGDLLERYLASVMEPQGWVWCSGSMVRAVDFIKPPTAKGNRWGLLQVKNRDNSENSSSSAIRIGTDIQKWFRTFSKKTGSNWAAFPDEAVCPLLSEQAFLVFVKDYLVALK